MVPRRSGSARVGLAIVAGVLVASSSCTLVEGDAKGGPGAACTKDEDCESSSCRTEGFCGVNGCRGDGDCPTGWTCETTKGDPLFGIGGGKTYCEPSCDACPAGTGCEGNHGCEPLQPRVTVGGDVPRVGQPVNLELTIDSRGRPFTNVRWTFSERASDGAKPSPSAGTGTRIAGVTFPVAGPWLLEVLLDEPTGKQSGARVEVVACGGAGAPCSGAGTCCEGECALLRWDAGVTNRTSYCVDRCPASCAPGYSCRPFDRFHDGALPTGDFCLPGPPSVTIASSSQAPTIADEVTFTASATSPANLAILGYEWFTGESSFAVGRGPTLTRTFDRAGDYRVRVEARDDMGQIAKAEVTIRSCIPAGETCFRDEPCCGGTQCTSGKCQ